MSKAFGLDMDNKSKSIALGLGILLVTFFLCSNIMKANARKADSIRKKIGALSKKFTLRVDIENIEKKQQEYAIYFYDNINQQALRAIISDIARDTGVDIVSIKPLGSESIAGIAKGSLDISMRATYNQIGDFISRIEGLDRVTKIESIAMEGVSDFKSYTVSSEESRREIVQSDAQLAVYMIVSAYSTKG
jgi:ACT domain-containing protein